MSKVKGSLLLEIARLIRTNKDKDWKKYLTEEDFAIINGRVLASSWYPMETYERAGWAIFQEIGGGKLEMARTWGRFVAEDVVNRYYPNLVRERDMMLALERFKLIRQQWYQFDDPNLIAIQIEPLGTNQAKITFRTDHHASFEAHAHQTMGTFERLIELCGKKDVKAVITEHDWDSDHPYAVLVCSWK